MFEYSIAYPEALGLVEEFVEYAKEADKYGGVSSEAKLYRYHHQELNEFGMKKDDEGKPLTFGWDELEVDKVPIWQIDVDYATEDDEYQAILDRYEGVEETAKTNAYLYDARGNPTEYCLKRYERNAIEIEFPVERIKDYVSWYTNLKLKKPEDWPKNVAFYEDDWFLMENQDFYLAMRKKEIFTERRDFREVPTREVFKQYLEYRGKAPGKRRLDIRWKYRKTLEPWLLLTEKVTEDIRDKEEWGKMTPEEKEREKRWGRDIEIEETLEEIEEKLKR